MLFEILEVLKYAISEIFTSTLRIIQIVISTTVTVFQIIGAGWAVSSILEKIMIMTFAFVIVYAAYKLLWDSAKLIVVFFAIVFILLFLEGFLI